MKKQIVALALAAWMVLGLSGCGKQAEPEPVPTPPAPVETPEPAPAPPPPPEPEEPAGTNPLTGEPMEPEKETLRPIAVMFNNLKGAQPQVGISQADMIYEMEAEGGITRMLGLFQSLDGVDTLGSIRSTRAYYLELALGHDALLVHAGGSPEAYRDIPVWKVDNMDGVNGGSDAQIFWRDKERRKTMGYEHTLVTSGEKIQAYVDGHFRAAHPEGYAHPLVFAADGTPKDGVAAEHLTLRFSPYKTGTFDYDAEKKAYLAGQYGKEHIDGGNGEQVSAVNVLVLETDISQIAGDKALRMKARLTGSGKGTFFCGGKAAEIQWSKADRNSPFLYAMPDGSPLTLGEGITYICIIDPDRSTLTIA